MSNRIVSLIASATEIVHALGLGQELVGRSHECDVPHEVQTLPVCSKPRIDVHATSGEIDRQVRQSLTEALSIYEVSAEELNRLQPTHLLTQTQCDVCAVSLTDVQQALHGLVASQPTIVSHNAATLNGIWQDIQATADALGVSERGAELVQSLTRRLQEIRDRVGEPPHRPRVVCMEWLQPMMAAGNWTPELIEIAGGIPLLAEAGKHSPGMEWGELVRTNPDVIVLAPCGFDIPRTISELGVLFETPDWFELRAVRQGRVYLADGNQFFNRPGPRVVETAEVLFEILHDIGHNRPANRFHRTGWLRLEEC